MILLFHHLYYLIATSLKYFQELDIFRSRGGGATNTICNESSWEEVKCYEEIRFDPPLYRQRYVAVKEVLLRENARISCISRVVDFGCGELNFVWYLKYICAIREMLCVDVNENALRKNIYKARPNMRDYSSKRTRPLNISVLLGSISDPDYRLLGSDVVVGIELIEHLYPDVLEAIPYNIFGYVQPQVVILTTPNADFNVLFPRRFTFRNFDHKFEWSRDQFQSWALNIVNRFPKYRVEFEGIGHGPNGTEHFGCCSQMAIFTRFDQTTPQDEPSYLVNEVNNHDRSLCDFENSYGNNTVNKSYGICTYMTRTKLDILNERETTATQNYYYKEIACTEFPHDLDDRNNERKINEGLHKINSPHLASFYNEENGRSEYPLYELRKNEDGVFSTKEEMQEVLEEEVFQIEERTSSVFNDDVKYMVYNGLPPSRNNGSGEFSVNSDISSVNHFASHEKDYAETLWTTLPDESVQSRKVEWLQAELGKQYKYYRNDGVEERNNEKHNCGNDQGEMLIEEKCQSKSPGEISSVFDVEDWEET